MSLQTLPIVCIAKGCTTVVGEVTCDTAYGTYPAYGYLCGQHSANVAANIPTPLDPPPALPAPAVPITPFPAPNASAL
jgi:hypothetical protein